MVWGMHAVSYPTGFSPLLSTSTYTNDEKIEAPISPVSTLVPMYVKGWVLGVVLMGRCTLSLFLSNCLLPFILFLLHILTWGTESWCFAEGKEWRGKVQQSFHFSIPVSGAGLEEPERIWKCRDSRKQQFPCWLRPKESSPLYTGEGREQEAYICWWERKQPPNTGSGRFGWTSTEHERNRGEGQSKIS